LKIEILLKGREKDMVNYVALYKGNSTFEAIAGGVIGGITIILIVALYYILCKIFEKILPKYKGNEILSVIICCLFAIVLLNIYPKVNYATKKYSNYGIENRKHFVENYNKIQNQIKYRMDIQNKDEYVNKVLNKFYGNVDVSVPNEEILKKLKR
jgi:hypothetical protein